MQAGAILPRPRSSRDARRSAERRSGDAAKLGERHKDDAGGGVELGEGQLVVVTRVNGLRLTVRPETE